MTPVNVIKSSQAKELLKGESIYKELLNILNSYMIVDAHNSRTKIMYKDFKYLVVVKSKKDSSVEYLCPVTFESSCILRPIYIAGDEAVLGKKPIGGVISPCNIDDIKDNIEEFNRSPIYAHVIDTVIVLDEMPKTINLKIDILNMPDTQTKYNTHKYLTAYC